MKINSSKIYRSIINQEKLPRKIKKHIIGKKISQSKLKRLINSVVISKGTKTMYERPVANVGVFCPNCGCYDYVGTGNKCAYPEHWEYFHCIRCNKVVAKIDNSPFIHILQTKDLSF